MAAPIANSSLSTARHGLGAWSWPLAALTLSIVAVIIAFWDTSASLVNLWANSDAYGHGFFIPPIAAYLVWSRRDQVLALPPRPTPLGLVLTLGACLVWVVAQAASIALLAQLAFVAVLQTLVIVLLGWRVAWALLFPLAYLYLMVPFGDFLIPFLQDVTAEAVVRMLRLLGIPVFLDGIFLSIPTGQFEVAEACAGLRFMIAIVALGLVYAHLMYRSLWRQILFMVLAIAVTIGANCLRALGIVLIAYATDHEVAVGADHLVYGWVFLSLVMLILFLLGLTFRDTNADEAPIEPPAATSAPSEPSSRLLAATTAGGLALVIGTSVYAAQITTPSRQAYQVALVPPAAQAPWVLTSVSEDGWSPQFMNADEELRAAYRSGEKLAHLHLAFYAEQREGAEVVNTANRLADGERWARVRDLPVDLDLGGGAVVRLGTVIQGPGGRKHLAVRWYWVDGTLTPSPQMAKLLQIRGILLDRSRAAAAIVVSTPLAEDTSSANETLASLLAALSDLESILRAASAQALTADPATAPE